MENKSSVKIIESPTVNPKTKKKSAVKIKIKAQVDTEAQVIVHCSFKGTEGSLIRIWKSTFLMDKDSSHASKLMHTENISIYPKWTQVHNGKIFHFTLFFRPLPKGCKQFDLIEKIPQPGGFEVRNILRNKSDVYRVAV